MAVERMEREKRDRQSEKRKEKEHFCLAHRALWNVNTAWALFQVLLRSGKAVVSLCGI